MIKKTVTYESLEDGSSVTEDFYFNINKLDILEMDLYLEGGIEGTLEELQRVQDTTRAWELFKEILLNAYCVRDGRGVTKKDDKGRPLKFNFEASPALGEIIVDFLQDPEEAGRFINNMFPKNLVAEAQKENAEKETTPPPTETVELPQVEEKDREPTDEELLAMDPTKMTRPQLVRAMALRSKQS